MSYIAINSAVKDVKCLSNQNPEKVLLFYDNCAKLNISDNRMSHLTCAVLLQVVDYAIARRIVDLHCRNEESVDRYYTIEEIKRYITFARQFKPKVPAHLL